MNNEEMQKRWPYLPPYRARSLTVEIDESKSGIQWDIDQDSIDDIIAYFQAAKEAMNN